MTAKDNSTTDLPEGGPYRRLSDKILSALNLALEQRDVHMAEALSRALQLCLTRNVSENGLEDRREFTDDIEKALREFEELRSNS